MKIIYNSSGCKKDKIGSRDHGGKMEDLLKDHALRDENSLKWNNKTMGRYKPDPEKQKALLYPTASEYINKAQGKVKNVYDDPEGATVNLSIYARNILAGTS